MTEVIELGCADEYEVWLMNRGADTKLRDITTWSNLQYNRVIDDASTATITLGSAFGGMSCCSDVAGLRDWEFQVRIRRNGETAWQGPITSLRRDNQGIVTITCRDIMAVLQRRLCLLNHVYTVVDMATVFNDVINGAMAPDNVWGLTASATATGIPCTRTFDSDQLPYAFDVVQELARTGVDYTVINGVLIAGNFYIPSPTIATITESHLLTVPGVTIDGLTTATEWRVGAGGAGANGFEFIGIYGGIDPYVGLLQASIVEPTIGDLPSAQANAKSRWALTSGSIVTVDSIQLGTSAPTTMSLLVPGALVQLQIDDDCFPLTGTFRLQSVQVTVDSSKGPSETVAISLQPVGTQTL